MLVVCGASVCLFCRVRVHGLCAHVCHSVSLLRSLVTQGSQRGDLACRRRPFVKRLFGFHFRQALITFMNGIQFVCSPAVPRELP